MNPRGSSGVVARELRHDVRNQLSALRTTLAVLEQNLATPQRFARSVHACAGVLQRLTAEIQEYFALETGESILAECDLDRLVADALQIVASPAASLGIDIVFNHPHRVTIRSRPVLVMMALRHTLRALMRLAVKRISITIECPEKTALVAFSYGERRDLALPIREEIDEDLDAVHECLALCGGALESAASRLTISLPLDGAG